MGEIAEAMITGVCCEMCGVDLDCDECADIGTPAYCSPECARNRDAHRSQVCYHKGQDEQREAGDIEKVCECGAHFIFTVGEQKFFERQGLMPPKRCAPCRAKKKARFESRNER